MNFIIFSNYTTDSTLDLKLAAEARGCNVQIANSLNDVKTIEKNDGGIDIFYAKFSHRLYLETIKVVEYLASKPVTMNVGMYGAKQAFDKYGMYQTFSAHNIPTPETYLVVDAGEYIPQPLTYPVIIKPTDENQGEGIAIANSEKELEAILNTMRHTYNRCIAQTFIKESRAQDIRLLVVGDRVVAAMERTGPEGSIISNVSKGGSARPIEPTPQETAMALDTARAFGVVCAGIDIIRSANGPLVLEINPSPGLKIARIVDVPVAELIVNELISRYNSGLNS